jgi:hypothetical protein
MPEAKPTVYVVGFLYKPKAGQCTAADTMPDEDFLLELQRKNMEEFLPSGKPVRERTHHSLPSLETMAQRLGWLQVDQTGTLVVSSEQYQLGVRLEVTHVSQSPGIVLSLSDLVRQAEGIATQQEAPKVYINPLPPGYMQGGAHIKPSTLFYRLGIPSPEVVAGSKVTDIKNYAPGPVVIITNKWKASDSAIHVMVANPFGPVVLLESEPKQPK